MNMFSEKHIRLRVGDPDVGGVLGDHPIIRSSATGKTRILDQSATFFDTQDLRLHKMGLTLTITRSGEGWEQRLVGMDGKGWRKKLPQPELDLRKPTRLGRKIMASLKGRTFISLFRVEVERTLWSLRFPEGCRMEVSWEKGVLRRQGGDQPINDLVLELKSGDPDRLFQAALSLAYSVKPVLEGISPVDRGFAELFPDLVPAISIAAIGVAGKATTEEMFADCNWSFLRHLRQNQCALLRGSGGGLAVEEIMRALDRMHFLLELFEQVIPKEISSELDGELAAIRAEIEPAVRWDRFMAGTFDPFSRYFPAYPTLGDLWQTAEKNRQSAHASARAAVDSFRFLRLILGLGHWLSSRGWREMMEIREKGHLNRTAGSYGREAMEQYHREMRKLGKGFADLSGEKWRQFNLATDRLAGAVWFFGGVMGDGRRAVEYGAHLEALRQVLLARNNVEEADGFFTGLVTDEHDAAMHLFKGWQGKREETHRLESQGAWEAFAQHRIFWQ